jgi:hypothetical protein
MRILKPFTLVRSSAKEGAQTIVFDRQGHNTDSSDMFNKPNMSLFSPLSVITGPR